MFWLPLILGLFGGGIAGGMLGSTVGSGGDIELFGTDKVYEEGSTDGGGTSFLGNLGLGLGGGALLLMLMSMGTQQNIRAQDSGPIVIYVEDDD